MGNRSKYAIAGSAAAGAITFRALRRARRRGADGGGRTSAPPTDEAGAVRGDKAHAPGHRHLDVPREVWKEPAPPPVYPPPNPKPWFSLLRRGLG